MPHNARHIESADSPRNPPLSRPSTADICHEAGTYMTTCGCDYRETIRVGSVFPPCLNCGQSAMWWIQKEQ